MSSSGDPPRKDPPEHPHAHLTGDPMPEAAPPDATEIGSVDELYGAKQRGRNRVEVAP